MAKVFKPVAQMTGGIIAVAVILFVLYWIVKLLIFLSAVALVIVGFALAVIIVVGLFVALFEMIRDSCFKSKPDRKP